MPPNGPAAAEAHPSAGMQQPPTSLLGVIAHADQLAGQGPAEQHAALQIYRNVLRAHPQLIGLHFNLGVTLLRRERAQDAIAHFSAVADSPEANATLRDRAQQALAIALEQVGDTAAAAAQYRRLLEREPGNFPVQRQLATLYRDVGLHERALAAFDRCAALAPNHPGVALERLALRQAQRDWGAPPTPAEQAALAQACAQPPAGVEPPPPHALLHPPFTLNEAAVAPVARAHARFIEAATGGPATRPVPADLPRTRLRLAYVVPRLHGPEGAWVRAILRHHDRQRFEVCVYTSLPGDGSPACEQAALDADHLIDASRWSDAAWAAQLHRDGIDVLLDPALDPRHARLGLFARRPVPLQVAWLADPVAAWSGWFDGLFTDAVQASTANPAAETAPYAAPLLQLPLSRPTSVAPEPTVNEPADRAAWGLPAHEPVIGLLGEPGSLDAPLWAACLRLLQALPVGVLWLRDAGATANAVLVEQARAAGVAASRLHFTRVSPATPWADLLACCDLLLDAGRDETLALPATALQLGVPMLMLQPPLALQRAATSLVAGAGQRDALCRSLEQLERAARAWLQAPRSLLAQRGTRLAPRPDARPSVQALEQHLHTLWQAHVG